MVSSVTLNSFIIVGNVTFKLVSVRIPTKEIKAADKTAKIFFVLFFIISSFINNQTKRVETNRVSTLSLIGKANYIKTHTIKYAE